MYEYFPDLAPSTPGAGTLSVAELTVAARTPMLSTPSSAVGDTFSHRTLTPTTMELPLGDGAVEADLSDHEVTVARPPG
ncbi:hypothetical protein ACFQE1_11625, partial [Halobium palmae]